MAAATNGDVEFVSENDHMTSAVIKQLRRATGAFISGNISVAVFLIRDIRLEWNGVKEIQYSPQSLVSLFQGGSFSAYGIFKEFESEEKAISTLKGSS